jgi:predicted RNA-binding Zn ribbon-like protein
MVKSEPSFKNWKFVGERLCLDFVNTVGGRISRGKHGRDYSDVVLREKFAGYQDLLEWAQLAGAVNPREVQRLSQSCQARRKAARLILARAVSLREALYRIFKSAVEKWPPLAADIGILAQEVAIARSHQRLVHSGAGLAWAWADEPGALDRMLWPVSLSAAELLTSADLFRLRQCGGHECGWMFLDTSRNRSRQWCDMKDCGNRAKVQRFRRRQQKALRRRRA